MIDSILRPSITYAKNVRTLKMVCSHCIFIPHGSTESSTPPLRQESDFFKTNPPTVIFGTQKNGSLQIDSLAANIFFSVTETSNKMASLLWSKKLKILCYSDHVILSKFLEHVIQILIKGYYTPNLK